MKRRDFVKAIGLGAAASQALGGQAGPQRGNDEVRNPNDELTALSPLNPQSLVAGATEIRPGTAAGHGGRSPARGVPPATAPWQGEPAVARPRAVPVPGWPDGNPQWKVPLAVPPSTCQNQHPPLGGI